MREHSRNQCRCTNITVRLAKKNVQEFATKTKETRSKYVVNRNTKRDAELQGSDAIFDMPWDTVAGPLTLLLLSQLLLFIGVGAVIPSIPLYGKEIGLSGVGNGVVISAPAVAMLLGSKFGGNFADLARKPAMMYGMAVIAVSDFGTACATGLGTLVLARLGLGAGRCISEAGERGLLADLAQRVPEQRGRILAAQQATCALGVAIGAPLGGIVVGNYGPRASFLCVTAAALAALVFYAFLPETAIGAKVGDATTINIKSTATKDDTIQQGEWRELLEQREWRGLALCQSGASFGYAAKIASIPLLATATLPGGAVGAGALLSVAALSGLVGAPLGGWLTDQVGARTTAVCSGVLGAVALLMVPVTLQASDFISSVTVIHVGNVDMSLEAFAFSLVVMTWSLAVSAQAPSLVAIAQELAPVGAEATALALPRAAGDGTYIVAPLILGFTADTYTQFMGIECGVAGAAILLGTTALAFLSRPK
jgi:MFS family permease